MSAPFSTPDAAKAFALDVQGVAPKDVVPEALVLQTSSKAGDVEGDAPAVRVPLVNFDDQVDFVPEGDPIEEADPDDSEVVIHTGKIALLTSVSREQWGQPTIANLLSDAAKLALVRKANAAYLSQAAPVGPAVTPPAGILNQSITTVSGDPIEAAGNLDALVDAIAHVETNGGVAGHILCHPLTWALLSKLKLNSTDSNQSLLGAGTAAPTRTLLNLPVLVDRDVSQASGLVVVDNKAVLSVYGPVLLATSKDYLFNHDSIALRITWRFGAKVSDPNRVVRVPVWDES